MHAAEDHETTGDVDFLLRRATVIKELYDELNPRKRGRTWTNEEFMLGFVGDVVDLAKLVMAQEGAREREEDRRLATNSPIASGLQQTLTSEGIAR